MRYAFVCDTSYQILSVLSFVIEHCNKDDITDLYVDILRSKNVNLQPLINRLKGKDFFDHIYVLKNIPQKYPKYSKLLKVYEWLFPKKSISRSLTEKVDLKSKTYDVIGMTGPFTICRNFSMFYPDAHIIFLEDGSGSYSDRIGVNLLSSRGRLAEKILHRGPKYIYPEAMYLYSPNFYSGEYESILKKLNFPYEYLTDLKTVFNVKHSNIYDSKKFIYIGQPDFINEKPSNMSMDVLKSLVEIKDSLIIRPHPSEPKKGYDTYTTDTYLEQWEIICADNISEDKVLISKYSTAQFIPKLIYDKEPILIFTYRIFGYTNESITKGVNNIRNLYRDKSKIYCVSSIMELKKLIYELAELKRVVNEQ